MFGLTYPVAFGLFGAIFCGGAVKGISGIGLPIVTMAIAINLVEPRIALAFISLPILVTNLWQAIIATDMVRPIKRFWLMLIALIAGMWAGAQIIAAVDENLVFSIAGVALIVFCLSNVWKPPSTSFGPTGEKIMGAFVGVLGGLLGGLTTMWGPPIQMYLFTLRLSKDEWIQTIGALYFVGSIPFILFYWQNGILNEHTVWLSLAGCVPVMLGIWTGERIRKRIDEALFRKLLLIALFLSGLNLIRRAFF